MAGILESDLNKDNNDAKIRAGRTINLIVNAKNNSTDDETYPSRTIVLGSEAANQSVGDTGVLVQNLLQRFHVGSDHGASGQIESERREEGMNKGNHHPR